LHQEVLVVDTHAVVLEHGLLQLQVGWVLIEKLIVSGELQEKTLLEQELCIQELVEEVLLEVLILAVV
jgi:hypothetical protein